MIKKLIKMNIYLSYVIIVILCLYAIKLITGIEGDHFKYNDKEFWLEKYKNETDILMSADGIKKYGENLTLTKYNINGKIINDFADFPEYVSKDFLLKLLRVEKILDISNFKKEKNFLLVKGLLEDIYNIDDLQEKEKVGYAIVTHSDDIKLTPTRNKCFKEEDKNKYFDCNEQRKMLFGEPIVVLHYNKAKTYAFIGTQTREFGWIDVNSIALTNRDYFQKYVKNDNFLMIVARDITVENEKIDMSSKLIIDNEEESNYIVGFPTRNANGELEIKKVKINKNNNVHKGYLPYTKQNVLKQAFKYFGEQYTWGYIDCSGLIYNVYKTFGFYLPRNSKDLQNVDTNTKIISSLFVNKYLNKAEPTSWVYMKGHIMIYLGKVDGKYYILHSSGSYKKNGKKIYTMKVVVTDLDLRKNSNNRTFKKSLEKIIFIK